MIKFLKFVKLEGMARRGQYDLFMAYYDSENFGKKYQLLADILHAFAKLRQVKNKEAEAYFKSLYEIVTKIQILQHRHKNYIRFAFFSNTEYL